MVALKECCCGCTLRTGTLILLWLSLVGGAIGFLMSVFAFMALAKIPSEYQSIITIRTIYLLVISIVSMAVGVFGICGIQKNIPKYLNGIYYLFCYGVALSCVQVILVIFSPSAYNKLFGDPTVKELPGREIIAFAGIFGIALSIYFTLVIKSCRDVMIRNGENNDRAIPDPTVKGYLHA